MIIKTSELDAVKPYLQKFHLPESRSHKGQNGKVLIIGGSSLFHAASLWAAEVATHFTDMVHYASTAENGKIFLSLKKKFRGGIVVSQKDIAIYAEEDDAILVGPGMVRGNIKQNKEAAYTHDLTRRLIEQFPEKRFVFDAGALQMMEPRGLKKLAHPAIITPHGREFEKLFGIPVGNRSLEEKQQIVQDAAKKYNCVILLKAVDDIISDGKKTVVVIGGNAGLAKGGTGDVLAGLVASFYAKNDPLETCVLASYLLKLTADRLSLGAGYWYNIEDIINAIPQVFTDLLRRAHIL